MKNIMIPTDFSENAWNALLYGISFFEKTHCVFHIVHVSSMNTNASGETPMYISPEILEDSLLKESIGKLKELLERIQQLPLNPKHKFETVALYGFLTDHLKKEAKEREIDLIIMGTKGASGLKSVSIGSNTGNVITKVPCTVLAVPENSTYHRPVEVGFPSDFQLKYNVKILDTIRDLITLKKSSLRFLYISAKGEELSEQQQKNKQILADYFKDIEQSFHMITGKKIDAAVQCFAESRNLDMLVMVAKNLNFLERILFRPTVEKISYHTKIPFLVVHE
ncbi:universal stress protein [Maribacter sp. MMG018]|uniref:universal stress protein n=1 Tax=Maribacter sp. MMG018 TaxID=2822688 RepID=UPI001B394093|nr:universal stress protein [Maribacter sp. MMG018]MBQ4915937.1 universal stress protein [Maribacter sp. MMG018]